jgi:hypothetical protein
VATARGGRSRGTDLPALQAASSPSTSSAQERREQDLGSMGRQDTRIRWPPGQELVDAGAGVATGGGAGGRRGRSGHWRWLGGGSLGAQLSSLLLLSLSLMTSRLELPLGAAAAKDSVSPIAK